MAINPESLQIRITDTEAMLDVSRSYLRLSYEVYHTPTGAVVAANQTSQLIGAGNGFDAEFYSQMHTKGSLGNCQNYINELIDTLDKNEMLIKKEID